jgi:hypothetical protein
VSRRRCKQCECSFEPLGQEVSGEFLEVEKGMELSHEEAMSSAELKRALEEIGDEEEVSKDDRNAPGVEQLAAIPEASARRSKCWAEDADQFVGLSAERRKAIRNEGMLPDSSPVSSVADTVIVSNMESIGVSLGQDLDSVKLSVSSLKNLASVNLAEKGIEDKKTRVVERDEQDRLEEEELDKIFLKNIYSEIMDELMDLGSDLDVILPRGLNKKGKLRRGKKFKRRK